MSFLDEFEGSDDADRRPGTDRKRVIATGEDRLARIRAEIARGEYDTPERFEAALERMLDRLDSPF